MNQTTTQVHTLQNALDDANPQELAEALRRVKLGTMLAPTKKTITNASVANTVTLDPPALIVGTCRVSDVSGGTAAAGPRVVTDKDGTAAAPGATGNTGVPGVALLSDDGATITFEGTVKAVIVEYIPRSAADVTGDYALKTKP